jgi:hypothetical protein
MFFFLYWVAKAVILFLAGVFLAAYFVGLLLWTITATSLRVVYHFARRPRPGGDRLDGGLAGGEHQDAELGAHGGGLDEELSPVLHDYLVGRH